MNTAARIAALTVSTAVALIGTGTAYADSGSGGTTYLNFGPDEGTTMTLWDNGAFSEGSVKQDTIEGGGGAPTGYGDIANFLFKELTGWDLPVAPASWIADKAIEAIDGLIQVTPATGPDAPAPEGAPDGGVSGGVTENEQTNTDDGQPEETADDGTTPPDENSDDDDCPMCPTAQALPNPDGDGPDNPYTQLAQPTGDGDGPMNPYTRLARPTDDGTGPIGPASSLVGGLTALGALG